jgi:hypothetical protein
MYSGECALASNTINENIHLHSIQREGTYIEEVETRSNNAEVVRSSQPKSSSTRPPQRYVRVRPYERNKMRRRTDEINTAKRLSSLRLPVFVIGGVDCGRIEEKSMREATAIYPFDAAKRRQTTACGARESHSHAPRRHAYMLHGHSDQPT